MKPTKALAASLAMTLGAAGAVLGLGTTAAEASANNFHLYGQINDTITQPVPTDLGTKNVTMTVTPTTAAAGDPIEVRVTSTDLPFVNGPVAASTANGEEIDAVIVLDGVSYTLRGSQNNQNVAKNNGTYTTTPVLAKAGWVVSSTPGNSSSFSDDGGARVSPTAGPRVGTSNNLAGTTGVGSTIQGAETTHVALVAPGPGVSTIGLKALIVNSILGSGTAAIDDDFDQITNTDSVKPGGFNGSFATNTTNGTTATKGNLVFTTPVTVTVAGPATAPGTPTGVQGIAGNTQVGVSWTAAPSNGSPITKSVVTSTPDNKTCTVNSDATGCIVTGLTNGQAYTFKVKSTNAVGDGPESAASANVTPFAPVAPGAPTGVTADAGNALADVTWVAPASDGGAPITSYKATSAPGGKTCTVPSGLTCTVEGLTNGTAYTFTVTATNSAGSSAASAASASVTPKASSEPTTAPTSSVPTDPRSATVSALPVWCDVSNVGLGANKKYSWPVTLTVSPGAAAPGSTVTVSVSVNGSPINSGPTVLAPNTYRMESTIKFNGKNVQLIGPSNAKSVASTTGLIFAKSQWPTVAKGAVKLPDTEGSFPITIQDIWYNNQNNGDTGTVNRLDDIFDNRCNASSLPQSAPKAFTKPTVSVSSDADAPKTTADVVADDPAGGSGGVLAATGGRSAFLAGLLALALVQMGAILWVRAQRSAPTARPTGRHS